MTYRIMTVCHGNICRSPMAQVVLAARLDDAGLGEVTAVDSSGLSSEEAGNPMDRRARAVLQAHGYTLPTHRARRISPHDVNQRDLILASTYQQYQALATMAGSQASHVAMIRSFDPSLSTQAPSSRLDLDDPWYGGTEDFEEALRQIEAAAPGIVNHVRGDLRG